MNGWPNPLPHLHCHCVTSKDGPVYCCQCGKIAPWWVGQDDEKAASPHRLDEALSSQRGENS